MTKGDRIRMLRIDSGMSQEELARKLNISKQAVGKYEKNIVTNIPSDKIEAMAKVLNSTPEYIMGWELKDTLKKLAEEAVFDAQVAKDEDLRSMIKMYMALPEDKKKTVKRMVEDYYNSFA